ncbi:hypothetical protein FIBSPDRAFT_111875 [Athelia psychrophila]|uniref:Uncharacterized protein n=1 Tax=Athelia psychrophila TaxID=1759441 RepID=A0A166TFI6_9AGAM|nr:hypothetical protein FIBSPDRAFT_111875 [Fibularhizoctonia sp. CBS 109695]
MTADISCDSPSCHDTAYGVNFKLEAIFGLLGVFGATGRVGRAASGEQLNEQIQTLKAPVSSRADAVLFLIDLQSTVDVCFDNHLGVLLAPKDVAQLSEASTAPKELLQKVLERATRLCNAPTGEKLKAGAAFEVRTLITKGLSR